MMLRSALAYAARDLRVLPLRERAKEPLVAHGVNDATCDADVLRAWWSRWPTANVGIAIPETWMVVDVDPRNGGDAELARLEQRHGALPPTVTARTGGGGEHRLFARPAARLRGKLGAGIDLLTSGRYILGQPSIHPSGDSYRWVSPRGTAIAQPPAWLVELARVRDPAPEIPRPSSRSSTSIVDRARAYVSACPPAISGSGGHTATFLLAQNLVRGFGLSEAEAFALMTPWNRTCQPPWSARDLARKVTEATRSGRMPVGSLADVPLERRRA